MASSGPNSIQCRSHVPFASALWDEYLVSAVCSFLAPLVIPVLVLLFLGIILFPTDDSHRGLTQNHGISKKRPSCLRVAARCISDGSQPQNLAVRWAAWVLSTIVLGMVVCITTVLVLFALFHQYCIRETTKMSYLVFLWILAAMGAMVAAVGLLIWLFRTVVLVFIGPYLSIKRLVTSRAKGTASTIFGIPDPQEHVQRGDKQVLRQGSVKPAAAILPPYSVV
jgi:hypothetical protein